ncbi:hypothetical protein A4X09_0g1726 [Tilletia walkeri]|uniref:Uncharacterized protein n=1 Tax=Tilletia walkeri TaxID=117179 RepID=A0A8X7T6D8_9BASI|nr:hypothetical protein A4X09_0g1726 [Tilletia walkeri]
MAFQSKQSTIDYTAWLCHNPSFQAQMISLTNHLSNLGTGLPPFEDRPFNKYKLTPEETAHLASEIEDVHRSLKNLKGKDWLLSLTVFEMLADCKAVEPKHERVVRRLEHFRATGTWSAESDEAPVPRRRLVNKPRRSAPLPTIIHTFEHDAIHEADISLPLLRRGKHGSFASSEVTAFDDTNDDIHNKFELPTDEQSSLHNLVNTNAQQGQNAETKLKEPHKADGHLGEDISIDLSAEFDAYLDNIAAAAASIKRTARSTEESFLIPVETDSSFESSCDSEHGEGLDRPVSHVGAEEDINDEESPDVSADSESALEPVATANEPDPSTHSSFLIASEIDSLLGRCLLSNHDEAQTKSVETELEEDLSIELSAAFDQAMDGIAAAGQPTAHAVPSLQDQGVGADVSIAQEEAASVEDLSAADVSIELGEHLDETAAASTSIEEHTHSTHESLLISLEHDTTIDDSLLVEEEEAVRTACVVGDIVRGMATDNPPDMSVECKQALEAVAAATRKDGQYDDNDSFIISGDIDAVLDSFFLVNQEMADIDIVEKGNIESVKESVLVPVKTDPTNGCSLLSEATHCSVVDDRTVQEVAPNKALYISVDRNRLPETIAVSTDKNSAIDASPLVSPTASATSPNTHFIGMETSSTASVLSQLLKLIGKDQMISEMNTVLAINGNRSDGCTQIDVPGHLITGRGDTDFGPVKEYKGKAKTKDVLGELSVHKVTENVHTINPLPGSSTSTPIASADLKTKKSAAVLKKKPSLLRQPSKMKSLSQIPSFRASHMVTGCGVPTPTPTSSFGSALTVTLDVKTSARGPLRGAATGIPSGIDAPTENLRA